MAKTFCTDRRCGASDAVSVWANTATGRPSVERMMRDAKVLQIYEGTNRSSG